MEKRIGYKYCVVCSREYKICPKCEQLAGKQIFSWKYTCDTQECFQIFLVLKAYADKEISKEDAKILLSDLVHNDIESYDENARGLISEILAEDNIIEASYIEPQMNEVETAQDTSECLPNSIYISDEYK